MDPFSPENFCRIFELPDNYPEGYLFGGGKPVQMLMVDWFNPWPTHISFEMRGEKPPVTWDEVKELLLPFLEQKSYVKAGRKYILVTDFGEALVFQGPVVSEEFKHYLALAKERGWNQPMNTVFRETTWIGYWKNMEAYENHTHEGRPVAPHRSGGGYVVKPLLPEDN